MTALLVLALLGLSWTPWIRTVDHIVYGFATGLMPSEADLSSVAFVDLGPTRGDHERLARVIDVLPARGVERIGLYLPLHETRTPAGMEALMREARRGVPGAPTPRWLARLNYDAGLADAIRGHGGVVLAVFPPDTAPAGGHVDLARVRADAAAWHAHPALAPLMGQTLSRPAAVPLQPPLPLLADAAWRLGGALPPPRRPGAVLVLDRPEGPRAGFLLPLLLPPGTPADRVVLEPGYGLRIGERRLPLGPGLTAHPLPARQDPRAAGLAAYDVDTVLAGSADLAGRTVILGHGDGHWVQAGPGLRLPEAVWQAYVLGNLLDGAWIHVPAWFHGMERALLLLAGLYLLALPLSLAGRVTGLLLSLLAGVISLNTGLLILLTHQLWLPVTLPALSLLLGHTLLWAWLRHSDALARDRREASRAHYQLGSLLRTQGQLEPAFEHLRQVREIDDPTCQQLYQLGHDLVRRRHYARAMDVYAYLQSVSPRYRDVPVRIERLRGLAGTGGARLGQDPTQADSALIVDGETLEKPTLGRYQIERQLGRGSMGLVYLGVDPKIGRKVAIKTLALNQAFEPQALEQIKWRFFREAEASGRLNHRNIVTIYDVGEEHDLAFIAMDYLEGAPLEAFTRHDALLPVAEVLEVCAQAAEGLAYAHAQQVIHRDVKPANMIYDRGKGILKITDFGIACLTDHNRTRTGTILGTPAYMSPEQASGQPVDGRSDLFSLGVTLYQLLCGQLPFTADTMAGLVYQITQCRHPSISDIRPELGPLVALIVNRALEKDPDRRYQDGAALAQALRECAAALARGPKPGQFAACQVSGS